MTQSNKEHNRNLISIAIPSYNSERYIEKCLESVLSQTYQNIEVIIVNDCSTDNSVEIIQSIIQNNTTNKQIRLLHQETNQGAAMAKNKAIENAKGDYIYFMDSDDVISPDCIEFLYNKASEIHPDIVFGSRCVYNEKNPDNKCYNIYEDAEIKSNQDFFHYKYNYTKDSLFGIYSTNILFSMKFIHSHNLSFKPLRTGEDQIFFLELMPYIKSCIICSKVTYDYIQRENSLSNYGERKSIPTKDVENNVGVLKEKRKIILRWNNNNYYPEIIFHSIRDAIWMITPIISKKKIIKPYFPHDCIKYLCTHPLTLKEILSLKRKRLFHITFYLFSMLPLYIQERIFMLYSKCRK